MNKVLDYQHYTILAECLILYYITFVSPHALSCLAHTTYLCGCTIHLHCSNADTVYKCDQRKSIIPVVSSLSQARRQNSKWDGPFCTD
jgi:hypothetical protein